MAMVTTTSMVTPSSISTPATSTAINVTLTPAAATIAQPTPAIPIVPGSLNLVPTSQQAVVVNTSSSSAGSSTINSAMSSSPKNSSSAKSAPSSSASETRHVSAASTSGTAVASEVGSQVLSKQRLQDLVREVDPNEQLDDDVEELLLQIADDFIENLVTTSCLVAKHRKANTLEVKDVQLSLEKNWNMWIPGFGSDELRPYRKSATTEAHKQRMALIRKALKKY